MTKKSEYERKTSRWLVAALLLSYEAHDILPQQDQLGDEHRQQGQRHYEVEQTNGEEEEEGEGEGEEEGRVDEEKFTGQPRSVWRLTSCWLLSAVFALDILTHVALFVWFYNAMVAKEDGQWFLFADSQLDLHIVAIIRWIISLVIWFRVHQVHSLYWWTRTWLKERLWMPKLIALLLGVAVFNIGLAKCLARLVGGVPEGGHEHDNQKDYHAAPYSLFFATVGAGTFFGGCTSWVLHAHARSVYKNAQQARVGLRKRARALRSKDEDHGIKDPLTVAEVISLIKCESESQSEPQSESQSDAEPQQQRLLPSILRPNFRSARVANVDSTNTTHNNDLNEPLVGSSSSSSSSSSHTPIASSSSMSDVENGNGTMHATSFALNSSLSNGVDQSSQPRNTSNSRDAKKVLALQAQQLEEEVSDHSSDDDSSSDDEDQEDGELESNSWKHVDARVARARERRRRQRSRKRSKKKTTLAPTGPNAAVNSDGGSKSKGKGKGKGKGKMLEAQSGGISQLLALAKPDACLLFGAFIALVIAALSSALIPKFTGEVVNKVTGEHPDEADFEKSTILLTCAAIACGVFSGIRGSLFTVSMARMDVRVRRRLFQSLLNQEMGFFDSVKTGDVISRLSSDTTKMADQLALNANVFLRSIVEATVVITLMFRLSWKLSLLSFVSIPIMTLISKLYGSFYRNLAKRAQDALADTSSVAEEAFGAVGTLKDFHAAPNEYDAYSEELAEYYRLNKLEATAYAGFTLTWTAIPSLATALTLFYGGKLVLERDPHTPCGEGGNLCGGDLVSFMLYQSSLSNSLSAIGTIMTGIASALGAADKVFQLLNRKPEIAVGGTYKPPPPSPSANASQHVSANASHNASQNTVQDEDSNFEASLELRNVYFNYPTRPSIPVLQGISLRVEPGQVVALVGPSGGGKSSIVRLFEHHYEPQFGEVLIGGRSVAEYEPKWLHKKVSIVGQEPALYDRSLRRNIIYGLEGDQDEPSPQQIVDAAKMANAHDFISVMPKKYATCVGQRGLQISGGQKQRIAIARALVRNPRILLLDEATSALDAESEAIVQEALDGIMRRRNRTTLIIAHRLSTVKNADKILVVDKGRIVESGSHDELLRNNGIYKSLVKHQLATTNA